MIRKAFIMQLKPGNVADYEKRHNPIWSELRAIFSKQGVHNYSIFIDESTNQLFGYVEIEDEARWGAIAQTAICQKWWKYMQPLMLTCAPDNPKPKETALREVFHID